MAELQYTTEEAQIINKAYSKLEDWGTKYNLISYLDEARESERKQFSGFARHTQARASILSQAFAAMCNENRPIRPSELHIRSVLTMVYTAISFVIAGWQDRSNYSDKLEQLDDIRATVKNATYAHDRAWARYWKITVEDIDEAAKSIGAP